MNLTFSGEDVDIFVFTYNRADLLKRTLQNLLRQTEPGIRIYVLDNASTDNTSDVVKSFQSSGVLYLRGDVNSGWQGNLERAKILANRSWTMLFHDDDLLHPSYCEWALKQINKNKQVALLASAVSFEELPDDVWGSQNLHDDGNPILCDSAEKLAGILYSGFPLGFCSAIYKTSFLMQVQIRSDCFGKIADRPFLLDISKMGESIVFRRPLVKYRMHSLQDSQVRDSGPYAEQLAALHALYFKILGDNIFSGCGRKFLFNNYRLLRDEYLNLCPKDLMRFINFDDYWLFIKVNFGASNFSKFVGKFICYVQEKNITKFFVPIFKRIIRAQ